jgi:hypothetical protein
MAFSRAPMAVGWLTAAAVVVSIVSGPGAGVGAGATGAGAVSAGAPSSTFRIDLYGPGVYTMQATWSWCTAAVVQIMRNVTHGETDHSAGHQSAYFSYMHAHNRYTFAAREGNDPQGFLAGLRRYVSPRYQLVASTTFDNAIRSAARRMGATHLPVALIVDHGRHAWVLAGFTATADPSGAANFRVLSVRIVGPLYGRQSKNGYDPPPNTSLSLTALRRYFTGYAFKFGPTPWDNRFVSFQPAG